MFHKQNYLLPLLLACSLAASAQALAQQPIVFLGEGGSERGGNVLRLLWIPKDWQPDWASFQVKSRIVDGGERGEWAPVNRTPISPALARSKDLHNVETDPDALSRLEQKLEKWLAAGKVKEMSREEYLRKLASDPDAVKGLYLPLALDYDFALLNGFGMVVRQFGTGAKFEFGLFIKKQNGEEQLAGTYEWQHGTPPNLDLPIELKIVTTGNPSSLEVRWDFDYQTYLAKNLNGFNIYRRNGAGNFQKLNENPIWAATQGNTSQLSFYDKNVKPNTAYTYAIAPLSLFGTEGRRQEVAFDPSKLPGKVEPPMLRTNEQATGTPGIRFAWDFAVASQKFIRGFTLQRRPNVEAAYGDVSALLPPTDRAAVDTPPRQGEYYIYRLKVQDDFGMNLFSNELLIFYDPQMPPPTPTGLRGEYEKEGSRQFIQLDWDAKSPDDHVTAGYRLYSNFPPSEQLILEGNIPLITGNSYRYEVFGTKSEAYQFAVSAVSDRKAESERSNVVQVFTLTHKLPNTNIWPFKVSGNRITLQWEYDAPPDLAGFRIFQDGKQVADEGQLKASTRQWVSPPLAFNTTYIFELQAVSTSRVTSKKSVPRTITTDMEQ
jgi:hypothetical protein